MEKKFLLYLIYIALIDIRERAYESGDKVAFNLSNLMHRIPLQLDTDEDAKDAYKEFLSMVSEKNLNIWLDKRLEEFYQRFPEYKKKD